ncbi:hypothetical protein Tco_0724675 [Tanacetum coccineum]
MEDGTDDESVRGMKEELTGWEMKANAWDEVIGKLKARLSKWKLKTLSVGGRLTLLKAVLGSTPIYNMSIYKVPKSVLHTMESLHRNFFNGVQADERNITFDIIPPPFNWRPTKNCSSHSKIQSSVISTIRCPDRGGNPETGAQLDLLEKSIEGTILSTLDDRWIWDLNGEGVFQVKDVRTLLDDYFLPKDSTATRWVNYVPIKINVFRPPSGRIVLDRPASRLTPFNRGVQIPDSRCQICFSAQEDSSHLFFSCLVLAMMLPRFGEPLVECVIVSPFSSYADWLVWFSSSRLSSKLKKMLEGFFYVVWWSIWMYRNQLLFSTQHPRQDVLFDDIVSRSFTWIHSRCNRIFSWDCWL